MGRKIEEYTDEFGNTVKDDDTVVHEGKEYRVAYISDYYVNLDGGRYNWLHLPFCVGVPYLKGGNTLKSGPVRTVTRKEIVPGVYGTVKVHDPGVKYVRINMDAAMGISELRAAAATLIEIADALEDGKDE